MSLDCGTLNTFFFPALLQLFCFNFFYWLGCFTTFDLHLRSRLGSTSYMEQFPGGLKCISWFAVLVPTCINPYKQHLTLQCNLEEPSDCIHLQLQGLSQKSLSRSMLHGCPSPILRYPKTPKSTTESFGEATSTLRLIQAGLEQEVKICLGFPPLLTHTPLPTNPTCYTWYENFN